MMQLDQRIAYLTSYLAAFNLFQSVVMNVVLVKGSFSLSGHFFTIYEDFFPSCSVPAVELDRVVRGC